MAINEISKALTEKGQLFRAADDYMYDLGCNRTRYVYIDEAGEGMYSVIATIAGKSVEIQITLEEIYKLVKKSNSVEELQNRIDRKIEKKVYNAYITKMTAK